jgi:uncharacterized SAM-binding protein YcdF (DUF218 family)
VSYFEPALPFLLLLALWDLIRRWRRSSRETRPWLQAIATAGLILLSLNAVAWLVARPLEIWYDGNPLPNQSADAIVILAGYVDPPLPERPYPLAGRDTHTRLQHASWLFKHWMALPVLVCAGNGEHYPETMQKILESDGVPAGMIWTEASSRSTRENAFYGVQILKMHGVSRIALVTEAVSMPRAVASFKKLGIEVVPAPSRFIVFKGELSDFIPNWQAIDANADTLHEYVGLAWYRLRGWI